MAPPSQRQVLVGTIRHPNGTPASDVAVSVSPSRGGDECPHSLSRTTTNRDGSFQPPPTQIRRTWMVVFPPIEHFANTYTICVGPDSTGLRPAYSGYHILGTTSPDTVQCVHWLLHDDVRVTCSGAHPPAIQHGGRWVTETGSGFYRLIVASSPAKTAAAAVQWVQPVGTDSEVVVGTLELPLAPRLVRVDAAELRVGPGTGACVMLRSTGHPRHLYSLYQAKQAVVLVMGPPGHTEERSSCS